MKSSFSMFSNFSLSEFFDNILEIVGENEPERIGSHNQLQEVFYQFTIMIIIASIDAYMLYTAYRRQMYLEQS